MSQYMPTMLYSCLLQFTVPYWEHHVKANIMYACNARLSRHTSSLHVYLCVCAF